jgi:REP element-mobilizing transposase RayT
MTMPRRLLVDVDVTRYYHCISRCVRRAFLCGEGFEHRKAWIEARLELLSKQFAVSVCGFAVMDNHIHVLCRLDPGVATGWSDEEVVRRWIAVYPPASLAVDDPRAVQAWVDHHASDTSKVARHRERLQDLGWFMKALKEPLARLANKEDNCKGTFWEARYKSIAILDEEAILATCAYIDLNPVAAGIAMTPETSPHTSVRQRVEHATNTGGIETVRCAAGKSVAVATMEGDLEQSHWLCPMQDRKREGSSREGIFAGFSLTSYLELLDWTARLCRNGKATMAKSMVTITERLGTSSEVWGSRVRRLFETRRLLGNYSATRPASLKDVAARRGVHHVNNALGAALTG